MSKTYLVAKREDIGTKTVFVKVDYASLTKHDFADFLRNVFASQERPGVQVILVA